MRKHLNKKEIKQLNAQLKEQFGLSDYFDKKDKVEITEKDHLVIILHEGAPAFFHREGKLVPTLKNILKENFLKKITVDMGAIKFVANGADIMRPGIVAWDKTITKDMIVVIEDETHHKPLAIGKMLVADLDSVTSGKVIQNVHYVGDTIWII